VVILSTSEDKGKEEDIRDGSSIGEEEKRGNLAQAIQ
jgi:hypothetical protein